MCRTLIRGETLAKLHASNTPIQTDATPEERTTRYHRLINNKQPKAGTRRRKHKHKPTSRREDDRGALPGSRFLRLRRGIVLLREGNAVDEKNVEEVGNAEGGHLSLERYLVVCFALPLGFGCFAFCVMWLALKK